jgi:hypothetical protein
MKKYIKLTLLSLLFASSLAANGSIKSRLNEKARKNLVELDAQIETGLDE